MTTLPVPENPPAKLAEPEQPTGRQERRAHPRLAVDCVVIVSPVAGSGQISARMVDLSLGGCRVETDLRFVPSMLTRVEVLFQLRGMAFRLVGVILGSRQPGSFAICFLDMTMRRRQELSEVIAEIADKNAALASAMAATPPPEVAPVMVARNLAKVATPQAPGPSSPPTASSEQAPANAKPAPIAAAITSAAEPNLSPSVPSDRRSHGRHTVDTSAKLLLVKTNISMPGRIVNLSLGGCRIRTKERFNVGIYVRVEAEFYLHGLPFRVGGVSQAILDKNTIGVKFLDMSERRREQLTELIAEIAEVAAERAAAGLAGIETAGEELPGIS